MDIPTQLAKKNDELGQAILEQATKQYQRERQDKIIGMVQRLMMLRDEANDKINFYP